ncbi:NlpC/P60 family protein [Lysinibacillus sp. 54212]|uniref:NlpC/P60 family protein n=1 Tax=Lysinibacillus sp. 54212 TaxID=3119829 RepID=UPI002FC5BF0F
MKRIVKLSLLALLITLFTLAPHQKAFAESYYKDVTTETPGVAAFKYLIDKGILIPDPDATFGIKDTATRFEAIHMLVQALELDTENITEFPAFKDVAADDPNMPIIAAAYYANIIKGNEKGELQPNAPVTRAEMAKMLVTAFELSGKSNGVFFDVNSKHWAKSYIDILVANGITTGGSDFTFLPSNNLTKSHLVTFIARSLNPDMRVSYEGLNNICAKETSKKKYRVNVSVTNLWNKYNQARPTVDGPSLTNPVNNAKWINGMSLTQKKWLVGKTDTQSFYNDEVSIMETRGSMYRVAARDQYVPYNAAGYPGWVPKSHIVSSNIDTSNCEIAIVTSKRATMFNIIDRKPYLEISYSTILPVLHKANGWLYVQAANNEVKMLKASDVKSYKSYKDIPKPTANDIISEAKRYVGLPYLWAGVSSWGYDCSGILYAVFREHGIMIPRDSFYQATKGTKVAKKNLKPGDLVFFAYNGGTGKVYHVGLYIGDGQMLHAPHYAAKVRIEKLDQGVYKKNYAGARRYL